MDGPSPLSIPCFSPTLWPKPPLPPLSLPLKPFKHLLSHPYKLPIPAHPCSRLATKASMGPPELLHGIQWAFQHSPPTWKSSLIASSTVFVLGYPILRAGLTMPGIASAFVLGTLSWRAFGASSFFLVAFYFVAGTAVTKLKIKEKEKEGIAEKRSGKRGPASVWGSGTAGCVCAVAAIAGLGGPSFALYWKLGFAASFCTKLSDTVSSEIGKAFGKTTYLVTTLKTVPRGTEGAISLEGTVAGLFASILLSAIAYIAHQIDMLGAIICVMASQVANFLESYAGAVLQDREGFEWLNNDVVNIINISLGAALAILCFHLIGQG